jgi:toxin ParE1/3/4
MASRRRRVVWSQSAEAALDQAITAVADESPDRARKLLRRVLEAAASLSTLSERGRPVPELSNPAVRQLLPDPYRLIYRVEEERVLILALLHQRQDVDLWKQRERP